MMPSQNRGDKLIEIDSPPASFGPQLHFQEFTSNVPSGAAQLDVNNSHTLTFNSYSNQPAGSSSTPTNSPPFNDPPEKSSYSIWSLEYYQQLFDVNTDEVVERLMRAIVPKPGVNYLQQHIQSKPDLYGPFWICVTLVFTIAISGNLANYIQNAGTERPWKYNFHHVTLAATAIFAYAWLLPSCLWGFLKYQGALHEGAITLLELLCVYGYSLAIYVPISVLWVIQISWLQWLFVIIGASMSGYVLVTAIWPAVSQRSFVLMAVILGCHILLAAGFMLYFFHSPSSPTPVSKVTVAPAAPSLIQATQ